MAELRLSTGETVKELRVFDGVKWVGRLGKVYVNNSWINFTKPNLAFRDNGVEDFGMVKDLRVTKSRNKLPIGSTVLKTDAYFNIKKGEEISIQDTTKYEVVKSRGVIAFYEENIEMPFNTFDIVVTEGEPVTTYSMFSEPLPLEKKGFGLRITPTQKTYEQNAEIGRTMLEEGTLSKYFTRRVYSIE